MEDGLAAYRVSKTALNALTSGASPTLVFPEQTWQQWTSASPS
jgi:GH15 family glucan-1,4-alpha-glucosidase